MKNKSSPRSPLHPPTPRPRRPLATTIAALLCAASAAAQTYTSPGSGTFTNPLVWNFGAGPVPASDAALALWLQSYGTVAITAGNDLNLTLNQLNLATYGPGALTLSGTSLNGGYAFTGGAARVSLLGSGADDKLSAGVVLAQGLTSLTFDGAGSSGLTITGIIASNTASGAPLIIATEARNSGTGLVDLNGANTFSGGVVLNNGTLQLSNSRSLGDAANTLTINGGTLSGSATAGTTAVANSITLNGTLDFDNVTSSILTLSGVVSGSGGVTAHTASTATLNLSGSDSYTGATTVGGFPFARAGLSGTVTLRLTGAAGSILSTSAINIGTSGVFEVDAGSGNSAGNTRVSTGAVFTTTGGFLQTVGNAGVVRQSFGTVNAGGLLTILAATTGTAGSATEVAFANLNRSNKATVTFSGPNLGGTPVTPGLAAAQGNVLLAQINGAAPGAALVGGGGAAGTKTISILPWALGDTSNTSKNFTAGSGFVTYDANGVRLLNPATEYNTSNSFTGLADSFQNMRITGAVTSPAAPVTVNSLFFAATQTIAGSSALTITSGALANIGTTVTISAPLRFGTGGAAEAVISAIGEVKLTGGFTAAALTKSGDGILDLLTLNPTISGITTINGGQVYYDAVSRLGGTTQIVIDGRTFSTNVTLKYVGAASDVLAAPILIEAGCGAIGTSSGALTVNSNISGSGIADFYSSSTSPLLIRGTNTYTGGTRMDAGIVDIDSDSRLGAASGFLILNNATLRLSGPWTSSRNLFLYINPSTIDTQANNATLSGPIIGGAALTKLGGGTLTISGADDGYSATVTLGNATAPGGTLAFAGPGSLNSASVTFGVSGGAAGTYALDLSGATAAGGTPWRSLMALNTGTGFTQAHQVKLGATAAAPVDLRVVSGTFGGTAGLISGFGKLVKVGTGTLTLNTANTFTGGVEVWGGQLTVTGDDRLGNSANPLTLEGGTLFANGGLTSNRSIILGATPLPIISGSSFVSLPNSITASGTGAVLNGIISGSGGCNFFNSIVALTGTANTYQGDTQVNGSFSLSFAANGSLGAAGSRIRLGGGQLILAAAPSIATTFALPRNIIVTASLSKISVTNANATLNLSGQILYNTNNLQLDGPGKFIISGDNKSWFQSVYIGRNTAGTSVTLTGQMRQARVTIASAGSSLDMSGLTREIGDVSLGAGDTLALGSGGKLTTGFYGGTGFGGSVTGDASASVTIVRSDGGGFGSNTNTFTGGLHILSSGQSGFVLAGDGALPLQSAFTLGAWYSGTKLSLDNTTTNVGNRIADTQVIHSNASDIHFKVNYTTISSETIGSLRGAGMTSILMYGGGTLNFGDVSTGLTRINGGTFSFGAYKEANMGTATATLTTANLTFGNGPSLGLVGGGGAAGSTTISILPYAIGADFSSNTNSFVTYGAYGVRLLDLTTEFATVNGPTITAGPTENVRILYNPVTLGGGTDTTVNSVMLGGRIDSAGSEKLIITSGLVFNGYSLYGNVFGFTGTGFAVPLGIQTAELQTGAGNTRELNVFTTGDLAIGAKVTTSGGLTKSGGNALYLTNNTNTYTGPTTINAGSLIIDNLAALGGSTLLQIGGGQLTYRGADATLTQHIIAAGGEASNPNGGSAGFYIVGGTTLTVPSGGVTGYGGVMKNGMGVLRLTGTNTYSGATIINAGALAIDNPSALGTNGRVVFGGIGQTLRFDAPMTLTQDFIVNYGGDAIGFGFDTNGSNVTLTGTLLDSRTTSVRGLYKFGTGELNLTATEMYTGATQIFGGTVRLSGADGSILNSTGTASGFNISPTVYIAPGAGLVLDNAAANNNNRMPDVWDTPFGTGNGDSGKLLMNGGEFKIVGNAGGTSERINQFDILTGTVTLAGGGTALTSGALVRTSALGAGLIRGTNLGGSPGPASTNWYVTDLGSGGVTLRGAGGAEGTPFINILPGFMGASTANGSGSDFVTYAADTGFRPLTAVEYTGTMPTGNFDLNRAPNIALTGAATVNLTTAISALKLGTGASVDGSGTLLLGQSTVLATGNASINVASLSSNVSGSNGGYVFLASGAATTLTVNSTLPSAGLTKYGEGVLALNGRLTGGGLVIVGQGTLKMNSAAAALNPIGSAVNIMPGATFDLGGSDRVISSLTVTGTTGTYGQASNGTVALHANRLTLYDSTALTFIGDVTGTGGLTKAFYSTGVSAFNQPLTYTGGTVIRGGTLQLGGAGTLASSAVEVRGGTLLFNNTDSNTNSGYVANRIGTSVPITLAGGVITFTENANTPSNHALGTVALEGWGTIAINNNSSSPPTTVTLANLTRGGKHGTITTAGATYGYASLFLTQIDGADPNAALVGSGGAAGSTTRSILPWASYGDFSTFLTYGAAGLVSLQPGEYATSLATAAPGDNVRSLYGLGTLTAPATVNSLISGAGINFTDAFDLTLTSGALAFTGGTNIFGVNTNALKTGAGGANTAELVLGIASGTVTLNYNIGTSGGVTKSGGGVLILAGTNTSTGGLTINGGQISFATDDRLGANDRAIRLSGGSTLAYTGTNPLAFNRNVETTSLGRFSSTANVRWQFNQPVTGVGGIGYVTVGAIYEINAANTYTGPTNWTGGFLYINGDSAFGNAGELVMNPSTATQSIVLRGNWNASRLIHAAAASALQTNGFDATWSGQFIGGGALTKNGTGSLVLTEPMPYSGALTVGAGEVRLKDRGSLAANGSTHSVSAGAALTLDDTATHFSDRLHDSSGGVTLNGGALNLLGNSGVTTEEVIANLTLAGNVASTVTLAPGSGQAAMLRVSSAVTVNIGSTLWRGTNLGVNTPGTADSASILLTPTNTTAFPLIGGAAPNGQPSISVIRGGFGDISATGSGTQLVTYDAVKGVRLLDAATEYTTTLVNGSIVTDNVKADGTALALANATTANALWLKDGGGITGAGVLTLTAGNVLVTGTGNTIANPIDLTGTALSVGGPGDLTLNGAISGTVSLFKQGAGTLTLTSTTNSITRTTFAGGVIALGNNGAIGSGVDATFQGGEIRNVSGAPFTLAVRLALNGPMRVGGAQDINFTSAVTLASATREIAVTNTGVTTISGVIAASQTLLNYGLTKTGPGLLVLANIANTYDGETTVSAGELRVTGSIAASALTTITGGMLSGTGTVGKLTLQSGVLAPGSSAGTLNCGDLLFSGGAFAVEIASALSADRMNVTGTAGLGANTELDIAPLGGFDPQPGDQWVIVDNDGTDPFATGGFRFTNDGVPIESLAPFAVGGETYLLDYNSGSGNDVVLRNVANVPEPATTALLLAGLPLLLPRRRAAGITRPA